MFQNIFLGELNTNDKAVNYFWMENNLSILSNEYFVHLFPFYHELSIVTNCNTPGKKKI